MKYYFFYIIEVILVMNSRDFVTRHICEINALINNLFLRLTLHEAKALT